MQEFKEMRTEQYELREERAESKREFEVLCNHVLANRLV
jgi:hypothetical protein